MDDQPLNRMTNMEESIYYYNVVLLAKDFDNLVEFSKEHPGKFAAYQQLQLWKSELA